MLLNKLKTAVAVVFVFLLAAIAPVSCGGGGGGGSSDGGGSGDEPGTGSVVGGEARGGEGERSVEKFGERTPALPHDLLEEGPGFALLYPRSLDASRAQIIAQLRRRTRRSNRPGSGSPAGCSTG